MQNGHQAETMNNEWVDPTSTMFSHDQGNEVPSSMVMM